VPREDKKQPGSDDRDRRQGKFPAALFEFLADTTRAVLNLALGGGVASLSKYPLDSFARGRRHSQSRLAIADHSPIVSENAPKGVLTYIRQLYFDTALSPSRYAMRPVLDLAGPKHIVFGSDFPYVHGEALDFEVEQFDQLDVFDEATKWMVAKQNALELFPRLAQKTAAPSTHD
jgi:6-methylsalicylate decarboxylase